ncbi:hypothetical protein T07_6418 [Trichinella nelsoni]|uniref:PiggyBac transposable element-derived protein domain-containing protein n=1 Tax=Trichinella nelsoni TaxID=6336 RepID=A0A0V0RWA9_9BILA|nr:hypothetical protein T07_6418 [Trichinella nelsoni]
MIDCCFGMYIMYILEPITAWKVGIIGFTKKRVKAMSDPAAGCLRRINRTYAEKQRRVMIYTDEYTSSKRTLEQYLEESTGTIKRNKPELPQDLLVLGLRSVHSSKFVFTEPCTAVSYIPEKHRIVLVLSTVHKDASLSTGRGS